MKDKTTPWFDGNVKPVRVGVYMRRYHRGGGMEVTLFSFWDGIHWIMGAITPKDAMYKVQHGPAMQQFLCWCGKTEP